MGNREFLAGRDDRVLRETDPQPIPIPLDAHGCRTAVQGEPRDLRFGMQLEEGSGDNLESAEVKP
jgi:hypothetical protein